MERKWIWRVVLVVALLALSALAALPSFGKAPEWLSNLFPGVSLGLDLQGGLRLMYEVEVDVAIEDRRDGLAAAMVEQLGEGGIEDVAFEASNDEHRFTLVFASQRDRESEKSAEILTEYRQVANIDSTEGPRMNMVLNDEEIDYRRDLAVKQAIETIGNRIDELGLVNTSVVQKGEDLIIEIPGVDEKRIARIKRIISTTARLEFKICDEEGSASFFNRDEIKNAITAYNEAQTDGAEIGLRMERANNGDKGQAEAYYLEADNLPKGRTGRQILRAFVETIEVPPDRSIGFQKNQQRDATGNPTADITWRTFYMERIPGITGEYVDEAYVMDDEQTGQPYVTLTFNQEGAVKFRELTGANVKRRMAIQLDDQVNSAPTIQEEIGGGSARITLGGMESYTKLRADAQDLVVVLRAGALPAPLKPVTESSVGPQLGADSIRMGMSALAVGGLIVLVFMLLYYRSGGIAADLALVSNAAFVFGILSGFGATLTLPGIAGIILTIGMAVDANVIIYERIREELREGKSPRAAVDAGYARAFWTIFDAQITTFIAGVVMLQYGTGAIKGFAVTLLIGIITSMFSAIFISRIFFDWSTRKRAGTLSI